MQGLSGIELLVALGASNDYEDVVNGFSNAISGIFQAAAVDGFGAAVSICVGFLLLLESSTDVFTAIHHQQQQQEEGGSNQAPAAAAAAAAASVAGFDAPLVQAL